MRGRGLLTNNMSCPCNGCQERYLNCHSRCYEYHKYRLGMDELNSRMEDAKFKENDLRSITISSVEKYSGRKARMI